MCPMITLRIDDELNDELTRMSEQTGVSKSDLIRSSLKKQLFWDGFDRLRGHMLPYGEKLGYLTDEDVFKDIS